MELPRALSTAEKDQRLEQARSWLQQLDVEIQSDFQAITGDASFRRYFRLQVDGKSCILMDAPPPQEDVRAFIDVDRRLRSAHLHAPEILYTDCHNGYLLLEDLGDKLFRELLDKDNANTYFPGLFELLKNMAQQVDSGQLAEFDEKMLRVEMDLFPDWYLRCHRQTMSRTQFDANWNKFCRHIIHSALDQPQCFVHRDFHSCNLLQTSSNSIGIIDFQDAVRGPLSYDFISIIWDRYIHWPRPQIECWAEAFRQLLKLEIESQQWLRYCDLMAVQRNIKIIGIFARLHYRDGKQGYIEKIPSFYTYLVETLHRYPEFSEMLGILEQPQCAP